MEPDTHTMGTTFGTVVAMLVVAFGFSAQDGQVRAKYTRVAAYIP